MEESSYNYKLRRVFTGCILYANDTLSSSSLLIKLQAMLEICFDFGYEHGLLFNAIKPAYFTFRDLHLRASITELYVVKNSVGFIV